MINNEANFLNKEGTECLLTQPAAVETLAFMQDLIQRWRVAPTPADLKVIPGGDRFIAGKTAMDIFRPVVLAAYRKDIPFEWGIAPLPRGPKGKGRHTIMGGSAWVPPAPNKNKEEAWKLLQFLTSPEVERVQIQYVGIMPARRAVLEEYAAQEPPKNMKMVLRGADTTIPFPQTPWFPDATTTIAPILNQLWEGAISPSVAAQEAKRQIDPILKQAYQLKLT
jgi:multiple sugar transport system substrate-binding protein